MPYGRPAKRPRTESANDTPKLALAEAADKNHLETILKDREDLLKKGTNSDFAITCGKKKHKVHLDILCQGSEFFRGLRRSGMKETEDRTVDFSEEAADAVNGMIHYLYTGDYLTCLGSEKGSEKKSSPHTHLTMYTIADKYCVNDMKIAVRDRLPDTLRGLEWDEGPESTRIFIRMARIFYARDDPNENKMRKILMYHIGRSGTPFLEDEAFRQLLKEMPDFHMDVTKTFAHPLYQYPGDD